MLIEQTSDIKKIDFAKSDGLVPVIVQDFVTYQVLMLGYANVDAVTKTLATQQVTFFSRSKQRLWTKGETSGNVLNLVSMSLDCDQDTLLVMANPHGPTCHTGSTSCFGDIPQTGNASAQIDFLPELEAIIKSRQSADTAKSYTAKLLNGPLRRSAQKVGEEGVETALAAVCETDEKFVSEASDLIFHLMVLMRQKNVEWSEISTELRARHTLSR